MSRQATKHQSKPQPNTKSSSTRPIKHRKGSTILLPDVFAVAFLLTLAFAAAQPASAQSVNVLYDFPSSFDCCAGPASPVLSDGAGNFYGTTRALGDYGNGSVFVVSPSSSTYETTLYSFCPDAPTCSDGSYPGYASVIRDASGNLYGTTAFGGNGCGVVYKLSPSGANWTETVLYTFPAPPPNQEADNNCTPLYGVIADGAGNLYGTTSYGLISDNGATGQGGGVFELSQSGGVWTEQLLYTYPSYSLSGLTMDDAGNLYGLGTNSQGDPYLFELARQAKAGWAAKIIHTFTDSQKASNPTGTPVLDAEGNIYGTTYTGSAGSGGTVYEAVRGSNGKWTFEILFTFNGTTQGDGPEGGVTLGPRGKIYGTTQFGGPHNGDGTVFILTPENGVYEEKVFSFNGTDGNAPLAGVTIYDGNLYGTTSTGGTQSQGGVYEVTP
jgi:uncharacterized repeat protein (TIGR03803 family)